MFLAEHNWKKEKTPAVMKGTIEGFMGITTGVRPKGWPEEAWPETVKLCATYGLPGERAICVWDADKAETLEKMFKAMRDVFPAETKITPIVQIYPAGPGLYTLIAQMLEMAK